jgi:hypothetical protein
MVVPPEIYIKHGNYLCGLHKRISESPYTVEPGYNDIGLYDTSFNASDIPWYQFIPHC